MRLHEEHDVSSSVEETSPAESQLPTMFSFIDEEISEDIPEFVSQSEIFPIIQPPSTPPPAAIPSETGQLFTSSQPTTSVFSSSPAKVCRFEGAISFIKKLSNNEYSFQANQCVTKKLKRDLINNKKEAIGYMLDSFGSFK